MMKAMTRTMRKGRASRLVATLLPVALAAVAGAAVRAAPGGPGSAPPSAEQLMDRMDRNLTFQARRSRTVMTVEGRRTRSYELVSYGRGEEDAAVEYLAPPREKGTRMLKLGDDLWIYLPTVDKVQKISGHMLRQGMMGSDVSYEDMMASRELRKRYTATVAGEGTADGRACWKLELKARDDTVAYPRRVSWIDKESYIPLKQELYALSGMLLKTWIMSDVKDFPGGRKFPARMTVQDHVRKESITRLEFKEIEFGIQFPKEIFSMRWLERH
jgi:outer membrane lipoprotein-sorting protein